jgi:anti-anti-sigma factor
LWLDGSRYSTLNARTKRSAIQTITEKTLQGIVAMEISTRMTDTTLIIDVKGEISSLQGIDLDKKIIKEIEKKHPKRLILNMKEVDYIDSQGMGSLIIIRQHTIKNKILFSVVEINENIRKTFEHSAMVDFFNIRESEEKLL